MIKIDTLWITTDPTQPLDQLTISCNTKKYTFFYIPTINANNWTSYVYTDNFIPNNQGFEKMVRTLRYGNHETSHQDVWGRRVNITNTSLTIGPYSQFTSSGDIPYGDGGYMKYVLPQAVYGIRL